MLAAKTSMLLARVRRAFRIQRAGRAADQLAAKFLDASPKENLARWWYALLTEFRQCAFEGLASVPCAEIPDFTPNGGFAGRDASEPSEQAHRAIARLSCPRQVIRRLVRRIADQERSSALCGDPIAR